MLPEAGMVMATTIGPEAPAVILHRAVRSRDHLEAILLQNFKGVKQRVKPHRKV
jgi:hypothetical protein